MTDKHTVTLESAGLVFSCAEDQSVLVGMERLGKGGIPVGCRGGGCGVCKIELVEGDIFKRRMSRAHVTEADEEQGIFLACRVFPRSDLVVRVVTRSADETSEAPANGAAA